MFRISWLIWSPQALDRSGGSLGRGVHTAQAIICEVVWRLGLNLASQEGDGHCKGSLAEARGGLLRVLATPQGHRICLTFDSLQCCGRQSKAARPQHSTILNIHRLSMAAMPHNGGLPHSARGHRYLTGLTFCKSFGQACYGTRWIRPKHHWFLHIPEQIEANNMVVDCFVVERQHLHVRARKTSYNVRGHVCKRFCFIRRA